MKVCTAPSGTNQTISFPMSFADNQVAIFGAAPISQQSNTTDLRTALINFGLVASGGANPLNLNGGAITSGSINCQGIANSGTYGGSGTAFSPKKYAHTFTSDADYTLGTNEKDAWLIDIQTDAVLTTTRNIIVPATVPGFYMVINRNARAIGFKTAGGSAINVASQRAAMIMFPGGSNAFRMTPDTDYTV
jgi:hypothetical protein